MKKKKIYLLFLLLISVCIVNSVPAVVAQANGKTGGEIGFIDGTKPSPDKDNPIKPKEPSDKPEGLLPKTGEEFLMYLTALGLLSLTITVVIVVKRKNKQGCS